MELLVGIELPTPDSKERLLTDARYLHEKFSALKLRCVGDVRRGQTSRYYFLVSTTNDSYEYTVIAIATTSHQCPTRFTARCRSNTDKAALALLERSPQGHAFAERYSTTHAYSHFCADAGAGKASGIQTGLNASPADATPYGEAPRAIEVASIGANSCHSFAHAHPSRRGTTRTYH